MARQKRKEPRLQPADRIRNRDGFAWSVARGQDVRRLTVKELNEGYEGWKVFTEGPPYPGPAVGVEGILCVGGNVDTSRVGFEEEGHCGGNNRAAV